MDTWKSSAALWQLHDRILAENMSAQYRYWRLLLGCLLSSHWTYKGGMKLELPVRVSWDDDIANCIDNSMHLRAPTYLYDSNRTQDALPELLGQLLVVRPSSISMLVKFWISNMHPDSVPNFAIQSCPCNANNFPTTVFLHLWKYWYSSLNWIPAGFPEFYTISWQCSISIPSFNTRRKNYDKNKVVPYFTRHFIPKFNLKMSSTFSSLWTERKAIWKFLLSQGKWHLNSRTKGKV